IGLPGDQRCREAPRDPFERERVGLGERDLRRGAPYAAYGQIDVVVDDYRGGDARDFRKYRALVVQDLADLRIVMMNDRGEEDAAVAAGARTRAAVGRAGTVADQPHVLEPDDPPA